MMIYVKTPKSKKKNVSKKEREQYEQWLKKHQVSNTKPAKTDAYDWKYSMTVPRGRETAKINSLNTGLSYAKAAEKKIYTGTNMLGIGTLHKSNAVPVFSKEEAVDMSHMRR